ncbi:hypothetical protein VE01_07761 [Pseudogymnoascus verrucosus]|uniref:Uncharacterized protein n=1 Tax=Pseudogymnoascus verrucosus TaxID=342668 RepID=A0A1B8GET3_9PEZI|nr:uncharacterized protein VE01_07761 [Pseudogymnoascus verrucosus]OBT94340.1 hypothetical protein VE01_07761 [Pseudogymnoascus verrucosus]
MALAISGSVNSSDIRLFLTRLSMKFHSLTQAAIDGNYHWTEGDFFAGSSEGSSTCLRADIHRLNGEFSTYMRDKGHLRKLFSDSEPDVGSESDVDSEEEGEMLRVAKHEVETWVKRVYLKTRGRELPGNYNYVLLSELYHEQSSRWTMIGNDHLTSVLATTANFVDMVLNCIIEEEDVESRVREIIQSKFEIKKAGAAKELETLIKDEKRQPITYNHYYTDNVQNARHDAMKGNIQKAMQSVVEHDQNGKLQALHTLPPPACSTETSAPPDSALSSTPRIFLLPNTSALSPVAEPQSLPLRAAVDWGAPLAQTRFLSHFQPSSGLLASRIRPEMGWLAAV